MRRSFILVLALLCAAAVVGGGEVFAAKPRKSARSCPPASVCGDSSSTASLSGGTTSSVNASVLFSELLNSANDASGLITNEYAYWNYPAGVQSPDWQMTSGSLFELNGSAWTGAVEMCSPDVNSQRCTDSAVFRLNTRRFDFGNVLVSLDLLNSYLSQTASTPAVAWDGVHIFLHYRSEYELYYASINRRDGRLVIKKKCPDGSSNGGTYYELGPGEVSGYAIPFGRWQHVAASIHDNADGSVTIKLYREGGLLLQATDTGTGCAPITTAGATGIRGDNDDFQFDNFQVSALG